jgi:PAS domain S-box-containing protein
MNLSIFKTGKTSHFSKTSRKMYRILALGSGGLAVIYFLFVHYYFTTDLFLNGLAILLPFLFIISFLISYTKANNKALYKSILGVYVTTSLVILYIAYCLSFNSEHVILMLSIFSVILVALPTTRQLLLYFGLIFIPLEIALFLSEISIEFSLLITLSFGFVFILTYVISTQKHALNYRSSQNAKVLKTMVNNTKDSIFLIDFFSKEIKDANENTKIIFGLEDTKEFLSKKYFNLFTEQGFIDSKQDKIEQKIRDIGYYETDAMFRRKDGSNFLGRLHLSPFEALNKKYYLLQIKNIAVRKL